MTDLRPTATGGRAATTGHIAGDCALSVGMPDEDAPNGRQWRLVTELARLETGHTPSRKHLEYWDGAIPWIGIRDATGNHGHTLHDTEQHVTQEGIDNSSARLLPTNTVCLSRTASIGYVVVMGRPMATSQDFVNWVCDPDLLDFRYLKYALLAEHKSYSRFAHGTTHQTIYFPEVKAFHICLPSRVEQTAIADVLSALDDKIEQNRRTAWALERLARAIFRAWFVDFEPVKAKAEGATSFPSMPQPVFDALPTTFIDTDIGPVPEGWGVNFLDSICTVGSGKRPAGRSDKPTPECNIPLYGGGGQMGYVPIPLYERPVLFTGRVGTLGLIFRTTDPSWPSDNTLVVEPLDGLFDFTYFWLKEFDLITLNRGSTQPLLTQTDLKRQQIVRPVDKIVVCFASIASPMFATIDSIQHESLKLTELRDYLLPKLLSGDVRVNDSDGLVAKGGA